MAAQGITETTMTAEEAVAQIFLAQLIKQSALFNTVLNVSQYATKGKKSVAFPYMALAAAVKKVENTDTAAQELGLGATVLDLDCPYHIPVLLEGDAEQISNVDLFSEYTVQAMSRLIEAVEKEIALKVVKAANEIQLTGTSNLALTIADISNARAKLNVAMVPLNDRFLAIPSDQEMALGNLLSKVNEAGSNVPLLDGSVGRIKGFNVVLCDHFASQTEFAAYHRHHVAIGISKTAEILPVREAKYTSWSKEMDARIFFGAKQMRGGIYGIYADETALV